MREDLLLPSMSRHVAAPARMRASTLDEARRRRSHAMTRSTAQTRQRRCGGSAHLPAIGRRAGRLDRRGRVRGRADNVAADLQVWMVGARGFEPLTSSVSGKRSPTELSARGEHGTGRSGHVWRRGPELNRCRGFCRPLPNHSATPPNERPGRPGRGQFTRPWNAPRDPRGSLGIRADDGIRTRDPHLGKVVEAGSGTCRDKPAAPSDRRFRFSLLPFVSRRFAAFRGTAAGRMRDGNSARMREGQAGKRGATWQRFRFGYTAATKRIGSF
jgi:hypothetical protein